VRALALAVAAILTTAPAGAQVGTPLNRTGTGARAAGMANAFVAVSDDGTAASWNPAGLALLRNFEASLVGTGVESAITYEGYRTLDGQSTLTPWHPKTETAFLEFASLAVPFTVGGRRATVQVDWHRLYDVTALLSGNTHLQPIRADGPPGHSLNLDEHTTGAIDVWTAAAAVSLGPRLSLGASVNSWKGGWTTVNNVVQGAPDGTSDFLRSEARYDLGGTTVGIGTLLTWPRLQLGFVYTFPFWADFEISSQARSSLGPDVTDSQPDLRGRLPRSFALGTALSPRPHFRMAFDVTRENWKDFVIEGLPQGTISFFDGQPPETTATRDTTSVRLGAERIFNRSEFVVPLRVGVAWEPQGGRDPLTRDPIDYAMVAFGLGINTNSVKIDAAVQYRWTAFQESQPVFIESYLAGTPDAVGRTASHEWRIKVSAIYRLADAEGLKTFWKRMWGGS
jgi:hypothetical protein